MRTSLLVGLSLALTAAVAVLVSPVFDLQIESVVLLGAALGAVVALVPDTTPLARLTGALVGVAAALVGFVLRAAVLPDSAGGRAVAVAVVVMLAAALVGLSRGRLPMWSVLLGAALFGGAYEQVYAAAPAELPSTAVATLTSVLVALAVGHLATAWAAPGRTPATRGATAPVAETPSADRAPEDTTDLEALLSDQPETDSPSTDARLENVR